MTSLQTEGLRTSSRRPELQEGTDPDADAVVVRSGRVCRGQDGCREWEPVPSGAGRAPPLPDSRPTSRAASPRGRHIAPPHPEVPSDARNSAVTSGLRHGSRVPPAQLVLSPRVPAAPRPVLPDVPTPCAQSRCSDILWGGFGSGTLASRDHCKARSVRSTWWAGGDLRGSPGSALSCPAPLGKSYLLSLVFSFLILKKKEFSPWCSECSLNVRLCENFAPGGGLKQAQLLGQSAALSHLRGSRGTRGQLCDTARPQWPQRSLWSETPQAPPTGGSRGKWG